MDAVSPILAALIVVVGGAIAYQRQKRIDRGEALITQRQDTYRSFIERVFEHAEKQSEETRYAYDFAKGEMMLIASDGVLDSLVGLQEMMTMDGNATGPLDVNDAIIPAIKAMRVDCFEDTKITEDKLRYISSVGRPTPLGPAPEGHFEPE